jgi:hypothetical protein
MAELDELSTSLHVIQIVQVYIAYLTVEIILITAIREWERNRQTIFGAARKEAGRVENRVGAKKGFVGWAPHLSNSSTRGS